MLGRGRRRRKSRRQVKGPLRWSHFIGLFLLFTAFAIGIGALVAQLDHRDDDVSEAAAATPSATSTLEATTAVGTATARPAVTTEASETPSASPTATETPTPEATPEGSVAAGGLRLRVAAVQDDFNAGEYGLGNVAPLRIQLALSNESEETITVSAFDFLLDDSAGTGYEIALCTGCPDTLEEPVDIEAGETAEASLYYDLPPGSEPATLRYLPPDSDAEVAVPLPAAG